MYKGDADFVYSLQGGCGENGFATVVIDTIGGKKYKKRKKNEKNSEK